MSAAFASAVITGDFEGLQAEFDVGLVVACLSVSLMVCGFGIGPLLWAPLVRNFLRYDFPIQVDHILVQSELYGRRPLWIIPAFIYVG